MLSAGSEPRANALVNIKTTPDPFSFPYWSQGRELLLLVLTHNVIILWRQQKRFSMEHARPLFVTG
jgi:hypothetical protein